MEEVLSTVRNTGPKIPLPAQDNEMDMSAAPDCQFVAGCEKALLTRSNSLNHCGEWRHIMRDNIHVVLGKL